MRLRDRIGARSPMRDHDGASGAELERAVLDDGTSVVLKHFRPDTDLTMLIPGRRVPLDVQLWQDGTLGRLTGPLGHAVRDAWVEDDTWTVAMDDVGGRILGYDSALSREQCGALLEAATAMHTLFADDAPAGLWSAEERMTLFAPDTLRPHASGGNPLPRWCMQGWDRFAEVAPPDVRDLVFGVHTRPAGLAGALAGLGPTTLLHGDYWTPNLAPGPDRVVAIDWALATQGSPAAELVSFLVGCGGQVQATKDQIVTDIVESWHAAWDDRHDPRLLTVGLVLGLVEMGWNLAWHAYDAEPGAADELQWWVDAARRAAETGLIG